MAFLGSYFNYKGRSHTSEHRYIWIAKLFILLLLVLIPLILVPIYVFFGFDSSFPFLIGLWFYHLALLLLIKADFHKTARFLLSISLSVFLLALSIHLKLSFERVQNFEYYSIRVILLVLCILPLLLFRVKKKRLVLSGILFNFLCLMLFDPVHEIFEAGYYQVGLNDEDYYFMNVIFFVAANLLVVSLYFLNLVNYKFESRIGELLKEKEKFLEELTSSSEYLKEANRIIEEQNEELNVKNEQLGHFVEKTNEDLMAVNHTLRRRNEELEQFSYALSHNLRGPVASILGLANLIRSADQQTINEIKERIVVTAENMDEIIHGLSGILDTYDTDARNEPSMINIKEEVAEVIGSLQNHIHRIKASVNVDINPDLYLSVPHGYFNTILYNLIHNSIRFHKPEGTPEISIYAEIKLNGYATIHVQDNGLGMDLIRHRTEIFKMSKRFHEEPQGNGLGLYLVKKMVDQVEGKIDVESKPMQGTKFSVHIPVGTKKP